MNESINEIKIVIANPEDIRSIKEVNITTWLETYPNAEHGITREDLEDRFKDAFSEEKLREGAEKMSNASKGETVLLAKEGDLVLGYCKIVVSDNENRINSLYILPKYQKRGIGKKLCEEAMKLLDPSKDIYVNVATYNTNAIAFYEKLGFVKTGKEWSDPKFTMRNGAVIPEMEMVMEN